MIYEFMTSRRCRSFSSSKLIGRETRHWPTEGEGVLTRRLLDVWWSSQWWSQVARSANSRRKIMLKGRCRKFLRAQWDSVFAVCCSSTLAEDVEENMCLFMKWQKRLQGIRLHEDVAFFMWIENDSRVIARWWLLDRLPCEESVAHEE